MGKGDFGRDVTGGSSSGRFDSGTTSSRAAKAAMSTSMLKEDVKPKHRLIRSTKPVSITCFLDVTGSNTELANIAYDKMPGFYGQLIYPGLTIDKINLIESGQMPYDVKPYLPRGEFEIAFNAVGDAYTDRAPLQVSDFATGGDIDAWLKKLWLEGNGGGQVKESYELAALFARDCIDISGNELSFMFMIADEKPYPFVSVDQALTHFGKSYKSDIPTEQVFADLQKKYNGNFYVLLNPYGGHRADSTGPKDPDSAEAVRKEWIRLMGVNRENIIPIYEEKSVIDLMLGIISMVTKTRNINGYKKDLAGKEQSAKRIKNVEASLKSLSNALVPVAKTNLPAITDKKKSGLVKLD